MTFTERLRALRELKGMNQKDFAELLDVQPSAYNKWEKGVNRPDYENLNRIAKLLNSTTDYLLGLDDQPSRPDSDIYAMTGLEPAAIEQLRAIWQGNHEPGYIPPVIRVLNDLIVNKNMRVLGSIAAYLYFNGPPQTVQMKYEGRDISVTFSQENELQYSVIPALRDMSQQIGKV